MKNVYDNLIVNHASTIAVPRFLVNTVSWTVYETQGTEPWCASITASNVIRNNRKNTTTSASIRGWLGDYDGLSNAQVASYIRSALGVSNVAYTSSGSLGKATIESEIDSGKAIYAGFQDGSVGHAIAIVGYNNVAGAYHIHNPWYTTTETMSIGGTYVAGGYRFVWSGGSVYRI